MSTRGLLSTICLLLLLAWLPAAAADLPLEPAPTAKPASPTSPAKSAPPIRRASPPASSAASPLTPPTDACLEWSDGCRTCQRPVGGEVTCSNVGIACVPKQNQCVRR
jgi:hypothetical protein